MQNQTPVQKSVASQIASKVNAIELLNQRLAEFPSDLDINEDDYARKVYYRELKAHKKRAVQKLVDEL